MFIVVFWKPTLKQSKCLVNVLKMIKLTLKITENKIKIFFYIF